MTSLDQYETINLPDGVDKWEAKIIAQREVSNTENIERCNVNNVEVLKNKQTTRYPQVWFVHFGDCMTIEGPSYLVAINKKDGQIIQSTAWWPHKTNWNLDWVFLTRKEMKHRDREMERDLFRLKNKLKNKSN